MGRAAGQARAAGRPVVTDGLSRATSRPSNPNGTTTVTTSAPLDPTPVHNADGTYQPAGHHDQAHGVRRWHRPDGDHQLAGRPTTRPDRIGGHRNVPVRAARRGLIESHGEFFDASFAWERYFCWMDEVRDEARRSLNR
jgi:hypothetical protein